MTKRCRQRESLIVSDGFCSNDRDRLIITPWAASTTEHHSATSTGSDQTAVATATMIVNIGSA